ncbi:hypothetical protein OC25_20635 [Pedobacter kyungheensis]|uniref:Transcription termination factor Rho n=1 Tax=Pedobacter kyungheensis TaxID=1069985 RepID=A0A0C1DCR5_9SPHI|nr:DUF4293 domain-containing protein [Pedobacter kyungheensis]KIA91755.1 hypothetical protein OC25_20635 [Pedobacter kyungheensis]
MIQRIQSIWLFLAAFTLILMLFLPVASKEIGGTESAIYTSGLFQIIAGKAGSPFKIISFLPLLITNIAVAIICFINIFNFRKRSFQKRFAILSIVLIGGFAFWCSIYAKKLPGGIEGATFGIGAYLPALAILFIVLAIFGINKDERLIRSAERLR